MTAQIADHRRRRPAAPRRASRRASRRAARAGARRRCRACVERGGGARELEVRALPGGASSCTSTSTAATRWARTWSTPSPRRSPSTSPRSRAARSGLRILSNLCDRRRVRVSARVPAARWRPSALDGARRARRHRRRLALRRARSLPRRDAQQGHHERRRRRGDRHRQRLARRRGRRARLRRRRRPLPPARDLARREATATSSAASRCRWRSAPSAARCTSTRARAWRSRCSASPTRQQLAMVVGSAGLASNLAALRALATEGIQRGHMALHRKSQPLPALEPASGRRRRPRRDPASCCAEGRDAERSATADTRRRWRPSKSPADPLAGSAPRPLDRRARATPTARSSRAPTPRATRSRRASCRPTLRPHLVALYAFARSADDFADEPEYEGRRTEALDRLGRGARRAAATARRTTPCSSRWPTRSRSAICRSRRSRTC